MDQMKFGGGWMTEVCSGDWMEGSALMDDGFAQDTAFVAVRTSVSELQQHFSTHRPIGAPKYSGGLPLLLACPSGCAPRCLHLHMHLEELAKLRVCGQLGE